jgi:hypothetical protein
MVMNKFLMLCAISITLFGNNATQASSVSKIDTSIELDLYRNGSKQKVSFSFQYYCSDKEKDKLSFIHQGGYKVFDVSADSSEVAIIGPLRPCIGIVVTDGTKLIAFHKHSTNSFDSLQKIIGRHLDLSAANKANLHARIFTVRDDQEWAEHNRSSMHDGKDHMASVLHIKDFLHHALGFTRTQIPASLYNLRTPDGKMKYPELYFGNYEFAEMTVAVKINTVFETINGVKNIKLYLADPFAEDVFGYHGTMITKNELISAPTSKERAQTPASLKTVPYDLIPDIYNAQTGTHDGYRMLRGICERRMYQDQKELYENFFKEPKEVTLSAKNPYNSLPFFPLLETNSSPSKG